MWTYHFHIVVRLKVYSCWCQHYSPRVANERCNLVAWQLTNSLFIDVLQPATIETNRRPTLANHLLNLKKYGTNRILTKRGSVCTYPFILFPLPPTPSSLPKSLCKTTHSCSIYSQRTEINTLQHAHDSVPCIRTFVWRSDLGNFDAWWSWKWNETSVTWQLHVQVSD